MFVSQLVAKLFALPQPQLASQLALLQSAHGCATSPQLAPSQSAAWHAQSSPHPLLKTAAANLNLLNAALAKAPVACNQPWKSLQLFTTNATELTQIQLCCPHWLKLLTRSEWVLLLVLLSNAAHAIKNKHTKITLRKTK
jgi:hypothetical protein